MCVTEVVSVLKKDNFKGFLLGIVTYYVASIILSLLNINSNIIKFIILSFILLIYYLFLKLSNKKEIKINKTNVQL